MVYFGKCVEIDATGTVNANSTKKEKNKGLDSLKLKKGDTGIREAKVSQLFVSWYRILSRLHFPLHGKL